MLKKAMVAILLVLTGCSTSPWKEVKGVCESPSHTYAFNAPKGWVSVNTEGCLILTRDGPFLQYFLVQERPLEKPFLHTSKTLRQGMLPQEAAEVVLDEMVSDSSLHGFKLLGNVPARIDGREGFRLIFAYDDKDGKRIKSVYYGAIAGNHFYNIRFSAVEKEYFEKDLGTFNKVVSSFKIKSEAATG
jgi:hypothetical protein